MPPADSRAQQDAPVDSDSHPSNPRPPRPGAPARAEARPTHVQGIRLPSPRPWRFWRLFWRGVVRRLYRLEIEGAEQIPQQGPLLLAPNHVAYMDPFVVNVCQDRPLCFMTWDVVCRLPIFGRIIAYLGAFPVSLDHVDRRALKIARALLERGEAVVVFPEGGRTTDGRLTELRPGIVRLAAQIGAPIVPVRIEGMFAIWPRQRLLPRLFRPLKLVFGPPIPAPAGPAGALPDAEATQAVLDRVRTHLLPADLPDPAKG